MPNLWEYAKELWLVQDKALDAQIQCKIFHKLVDETV